MIYPIIKVLVVKLFILAVDLSHLHSKPQNKVLILHELLSFPYHFLLVNAFSSVKGS
jgi:hypothetical protein